MYLTNLCLTIFSYFLLLLFYLQIASPEAAGFVSGQLIDVKFLGKNDKVRLDFLFGRTFKTVKKIIFFSAYWRFLYIITILID